MDGRFTPEREPYARSSVDSSLSRLESVGLQKSRRRDSPRAPRLQDNILDKFVKSHHERMTEFAKWRDELKPTLRCSDSASETTPQVVKLPQMSNTARTKVSKPKTRIQLERAQMARPYTDSSSTELVKPSKRRHGWEVGLSLSSKLDTSIVVREQSHETVLNKEPPKGSSRACDKSSGRTPVQLINPLEVGKGSADKLHLSLNSTRTPVHSGLP